MQLTSMLSELVAQAVPPAKAEPCSAWLTA
jgi:hypothetical protein